MFEPIPEEMSKAKIKIVGVGGSGGNAVNHIAKTTEATDEIELCAINTDAQALQKINDRVNTLQIGKNITRGLG